MVFSYSTTIGMFETDAKSMLTMTEQDFELERQVTEHKKALRQHAIKALNLKKLFISRSETLGFQGYGSPDISWTNLYMAGDVVANVGFHTVTAYSLEFVTYYLADFPWLGEPKDLPEKFAQLLKGADFPRKYENLFVQARALNKQRLGRLEQKLDGIVTGLEPSTRTNMEWLKEYIVKP